jgi:hypothetical protein
MREDGRDISLKPRSAPQDEQRTIVGKMYVTLPVSSNMMTTTVTVIRMMPLCEAARHQPHV